MVKREKLEVDSLPPKERLGTGLMLMFLSGACTLEEMHWIAQMISDNWNQRPQEVPSLMRQRLLIQRKPKKEFELGEASR